MRRSPKDISGVRRGRLLAIKVSHYDSKSRYYVWKCRCDCGVIVLARSGAFIRGSKKSCGCLPKDTKPHLTHGKSKSAEYIAWISMKQRCYYSGYRNYANYGGRGIKVCKRWQKFENFYKDMGTRPSPKHSLDRMNNDGDYSPSNCRWADPVQQRNNNPLNTRVSLRGESYSLKELSKISGISKYTIRGRIKRGDTEGALVRPLWQREN